MATDWFQHDGENPRQDGDQYRDGGDNWLWMEGIPACLQMEGVETFNEMQADLTKSEVMNATRGPKNRNAPTQA